MVDYTFLGTLSFRPTLQLNASQPYIRLFTLPVNYRLFDNYSLTIVQSDDDDKLVDSDGPQRIETIIVDEDGLRLVDDVKYANFIDIFACFTSGV